MEWEVRLLESLNSQLRSKLEISNSEISQLTGSVDYLRRGKENAESEMLTTKIEIEKLLEGNFPISNSSPGSMTVCMEQMKQAFMQNEEIIQAKNEEIANKDALVDNNHFVQSK